MIESQEQFDTQFRGYDIPSAQAVAANINVERKPVFISIHYEASLYYAALYPCSCFALHECLQNKSQHSEYILVFSDLVEISL